MFLLYRTPTTAATNPLNVAARPPPARKRVAAPRPPPLTPLQPPILPARELQVSHACLKHLHRWFPLRPSHLHSTSAPAPWTLSKNSAPLA